MGITDFENVCDFDSLYRAHQKARLGKRHKQDVIAFEMDLANNLWNIKRRLEDGSYRVGGYKRFTIYDPKTREIQALCYADRIVQHSLCDNVLMPFFENRLVYDNCACRVGKGTHFGMERLAGFMREHYRQHGAHGWILKADVRKFFQSVDHGVLLAQLRKVIPDPDVMRLLEMIVCSWSADTGKGLPMGNQTSQIFALYYLDPLDRLVKEKLRVKHYTRYMDDMVLLHPDKAHLQECLRQMRALAQNKLHVEFNEKTHIFPVAHGVDYLGWHFYLTGTGKVVKRLRTQNKKKLKRRMKGLQKGYAEGRLDIEDITRSMAATQGHLLHGHTYKLREKIYSQTAFARHEEEPI
ncbi:reverse transcriptase/maturase family protein [Christensenellaceae bacterium OttesenSCG-928-K19]|nr:reverse transcriptase/maturase family protein [Christensenellaceae bacterium OttesenSCG-928-K19]